MEQSTLADLERRLEDLRSRLPAHSVPARVILELEELEEEIETRKFNKQVDPVDNRIEKGVNMQVEDFAYIRSTQKPFGEAVEAVQARAREKGFRVMSVHDVAATLREKGFDHAPLTIVEV